MSFSKEEYSSDEEEYCCHLCDYTTTNPVAGTFTVDELFVCEDCDYEATQKRHTIHKAVVTICAVSLVPWKRHPFQISPPALPIVAAQSASRVQSKRTAMGTLRIVDPRRIAIRIA